MCTKGVSYMKKLLKLSLSLLAVFSLVACGSNRSNSNNNENNGNESGDNNGNNNTPGGNGNNESTPLSLEKISQGFAEVVASSGYTMDIAMTYNVASNTTFSGIKTKVHSKTHYDAHVEVSGMNTKASFTESNEMKVLMSEAVSATQSRDVVVTALKTNIFMLMTYSDSETEFEYNEEEDSYTVKMSQELEPQYRIYDAEAKQHYTYDDDDDCYYLTEEDDDFDEASLEPLMAQLNALGRIQNDVLYVNAPETTLEFHFTFDGAKLSTVTFTGEIDHASLVGSYTITKVGSTQFTVPAELVPPTCLYKHDEFTDYKYIQTAEGHRKVCSNCYKYLDEAKPHVHEHNQYGICEVCGYIEGADLVDLDHDWVVPQGFENGEHPFIRIIKTDKVMVSDDYYYSYSNVIEFDRDEQTGNYKRALFYSNEKAILILGDEYEYVEGTCIQKNICKAWLFKNVPDEVLNQYSSWFASDEQKASLHAMTVSGEQDAYFEGVEARLYHDVKYGEYEEYQGCYTMAKGYCEICHQFIHSNLNQNHENVSEVETHPDACHTVTNYICDDCHENLGHSTHTEHQFEGEPTETVKHLDGCHYILISSCPTCGEILEKEIVEEHHGQEREIVIPINECVNRVITVCEGCGMIISDELDEHHSDDIEQVVCKYADLEDYGIELEPLYDDDESLFVFEYCPDCKQPVSGQVVEVRNRDYDHAYWPYGTYIIHNVWNGTHQYKSGAFPHVLDDKGICEICGNYVVNLDNGLILNVKYNEDKYHPYWDVFFYDTVNQDIIYLSSFCDTPEFKQEITGNYYEYTNPDYPNVVIKEDLDENYDVIRYEIILSGGAVYVIEPSDFE